MGVGRKWETSILKSWNHFDGTNEEDVKGTDIVNNAGKYKGRKGCLEKR